MSDLVRSAGNRQIKVYVHKTNQFLNDFYSSATIWKDLLSELETLGIQTSNVKGVVKHTKATLEFDQATLPSEPFVLFLYPKKVSSGMDYSNWKYNDLRAECSRRGLLHGSSQKKEEMIALLNANDEFKEKVLKEPENSDQEDSVVIEKEADLEEVLVNAIIKAVKRIKIVVSIVEKEAVEAVKSAPKVKEEEEKERNDLYELSCALASELGL